MIEMHLSHMIHSGGFSCIYCIHYIYMLFIIYIHMHIYSQPSNKYKPATLLSLTHSAAYSTKEYAGARIQGSQEHHSGGALPVMAHGRGGDQSYKRWTNKYRAKSMWRGNCNVLQFVAMTKEHTWVWCSVVLWEFVQAWCTECTYHDCQCDGSCYTHWLLHCNISTVFFNYKCIIHISCSETED